MTTKKETKNDKENLSLEKEKKLLEKHPYETMSQIQNRYGNGREKNGSDGSNHDARGRNH